MVISLKQIFEIPSEKLVFDTEISRERLNEIHGYSFIGPVALKGMFLNRAGVVTLSYTASFTVSAECDRCLGELQREFSFDFEHVVVRSLSNEDNDDYVVTGGDELELDEIAVTDILPEMPTKLLCKGDCKGLCPVCGADLNVADCGCNSGS